MTTKPKHINNGQCPKCREIFERYPGFHSDLRSWFVALQTLHPDAHISNAGRGRDLQELYYKQGASRAHYGQSAHNYNAAIDIFRLTLNGAEWGPSWFNRVVAPNLKPGLKWYGVPDSPFYELPHVEVEGWRTLGLSLVE